MHLAHIVSDTPGEMNRTLRNLADSLIGDGRRVVGAVQVNTVPEDGGAADIDLRILPEGRMIRISQSLGTGASACTLDPSQLEAAVQECAARLAEGADLLMVNKFGAHESGGRGFRDLIATALSEDVPVLVGVSAAKLSDFNAFTGDLSRQAPCDVEALRRWLDDVID